MDKNWKYYLGISLFIYSLIPMVVVAVLPFLGLSLAQAGTASVVFLASGEAAFYAAAALLGKEFLAALKKRLLSWFRVSPRPPQPVSRSRHRCGVLLLSLSFVPYYVVLVDLVFFAPGQGQLHFLAWILVAGEAAGMAALFILGAPFWERLKRLFYWDGGQEEMPATTA